MLCPLLLRVATPCTQHASPVVLSCQEQVARQQLQRALDRQEARMSQLSKALAEREAQLAAVRQDASSLREQKTAVENWLDV
jgi:septal ring factor EnvC (AmiA/AmiB activator)